MSQPSSKEYYESQLQKKVLYIPNLSLYLSDLHRQVLKLPHEMYDGKMSEPLGMTYSDIEKSFCNGVDLLYSILNPIRSVAGKDYPECPVKESKDFQLALKKLDWCYGLMDDMDVLNDHVISVDMPDENYAPDEREDEEEKKKEENKNEQSTTSLPPNIQKTNDKNVGELEGENKQRMAQPNMEKIVSGE